MSELLECPFCGGEASKRLFYKGKYRVHCNVCDAHSGDVYDTEAEAIAAWNSRAERTCKQLRIFNLIKRECDGKRYSWHGDEMPNYCPNCGCKVVGE